MVTAKKISSVQFRFPYNQDKSTLPIFERIIEGGQAKSPKKEHVKSCIIYGRNGSGKSSLARALGDGESELNFLDLSGDEVPDGDDRSNIYVYNEEYIECNFKQIQSANLGQIVLFGGAAEDSNEEDALTRKLFQKKKDLENKNETLTQSENQLNNIKKQIRTRISSNKHESMSSWKIRSASYNSAGQYNNVTQKVVDTIIARAQSLSKDEDALDAKSKFDDSVRKLSDFAQAEPISWPAPVVAVNNLEYIQSLFEKVSVASDDTASSKQALEVRIRKSGEGASELRRRAETLFDDSETFCPTCFQAVSEEFSAIARNFIYSFIEEMNSNEIVEKLQSEKIPDLAPLNLPAGIVGGKDSCQELAEAHANLQESINDANRKISEKADNPDSPSCFPRSELSEALANFSRAVEKVSESVAAHNKTCNDGNLFKEQAEEANIVLAALEIRELVTQRSAQEVDCKKYQQSINETKQDLLEIEKKLSTIREKRKSEKWAAEAINQLLRRVFGRDAMKLIPNAEGYAVTNRGNNVQPTNLSTGERNILSLCYFFISIGDERDAETYFLDDQLVVLDDPISSVDNDNKYGVRTLLGWMAWEMSRKGSRTQLAIFTHDLEVAYELSKGVGSATSSHLDWELRDGVLVASNHQHVDYYQINLRKMFKLATLGAISGQNGEVTDEFRANDMRRVWEAFTTFELGENVTNVTSSPKVYDLFKKMGDRQASFLVSYPCRVFIHADSHAKNQILWGNFNLENSLTADDYRRFAREMLCFMHLVAPHHIVSRLCVRPDELDAYLEKLDEVVEEVLADAGGRIFSNDASS